jgi:hypothetical protein
MELKAAETLLRTCYIFTKNPNGLFTNDRFHFRETLPISLINFLFIMDASPYPHIHDPSPAIRAVKDITFGSVRQKIIFNWPPNLIALPPRLRGLFLKSLSILSTLPKFVCRRRYSTPQRASVDHWTV